MTAVVFGPLSPTFLANCHGQGCRNQLVHPFHSDDSRTWSSVWHNVDGRACFLRCEVNRRAVTRGRQRDRRDAGKDFVPRPLATSDFVCEILEFPELARTFSPFRDFLDDGERPEFGFRFSTATSFRSKQSLNHLGLIVKKRSQVSWGHC